MPTKCLICKKKRPNFNFEGESKATHCGDCKEAGMIDVKNRKCLICKKKIPTFNFEGESIGTHCGDCKEAGMINVKSSKCLICKNKIPSYGFPGKSKEYCIKCRPEGVVKDPLKKCCIDDCNDIAMYGLNNRDRCEIHKLEDDILMTSRKCKKCFRLDILDKDDYCVSFCNLELKYEHLRKYFKKREDVICRLLEKNIDLPFDVRDNVIDSVCGVDRPDFGYDLGTHYVFIEVDEDQHNSYKCKLEGGEIRRMYRIFQSLGGIGCIFIRYNPDIFRVDNRVVKVSDRVRHDVLLRWVRHSFKCVPLSSDDMLRVKYLFYDGYTEGDNDYIRICERDVV